MTVQLVCPPDCANALSWSVAQQSKIANSCGDGYMILRNGNTICAYVIDGMGSGPDAHRAASTGLNAIKNAGDTSLGAAFDATHRALQGMRGAAMAGAMIDLRQLTLSWAAVGDIDGLVHRGTEISDTLMQRGGALGHNFSGLHIQSTKLHIGDMIVLTTDGISRNYRSDIRALTSAADCADHILEAHGRSNDDRLVLAMKIEALS
ncbi:SpoIIE family protein phosphatase [Phaeobacter sp. HF9A]|uniref:SpoIIE family protein phosphatase n=1 Tax=Phaeobacter sp. HF9A TaxID=2721561 RepID=UPI0014305078|nr:SpoIIE family protein phosphatase [Phaeobacter sp. HF9A]NIZ15534.1 SpoIIE family protein phosphatase [Phaeobacter sp. HF9A]